MHADNSVQALDQDSGQESGRNHLQKTERRISEVGLGLADIDDVYTETSHHGQQDFQGKI